MSLHDYLARHAVMTLATTGPAGAAAAAVFYACDGAHLYFLSAPGTLHARNLAADPRVAATIQDDVDDWAAIKGVQLRGEAVQLAGEQEAQAMRCYAARFPAIFDPATCPPAIAAALPRIRWYRLGVSWWRLIDNSRGFGHAVEGTGEQMAAVPHERVTPRPEARAPGRLKGQVGEAFFQLLSPDEVARWE
ncbi:MAG: pyridoxamine 5'-phosphate oxidase family protein [Gammaproteobacteria bacterium]|nr:pyridoxamine 5'-phosphate oxidase family protein [Gammaproteobacteria bacterium]